MDLLAASLSLCVLYVHQLLTAQDAASSTKAKVLRINENQRTVNEVRSQIEKVSLCLRRDMFKSIPHPPGRWVFYRPDRSSTQ